MKDARLELRVDPELKRRVDARAAELGQKTTTFVERALEKALGNEEPRPSPEKRTAGSGVPPASPRAPSTIAGVVRASSLVKQGVKPIPKQK